jgi:hypothetical protein
MKSTLGIGDSLTLGCNSSIGMYMADKDRWLSVLAAGLMLM